MKCHSVQKKLSAYQDGELDPKEQEQVKTHLLNCQSCSEQFAQLERTWQTLGELKEIHPDPWFYPQLVRKIKKPRERGLSLGLQWAFQRIRTPAIASILLAVGILAGAYLGNIMTRCDFFPFQPAQPSYSQEAFLDSLKVFDPIPPGTLAHGYLQMVSYKERESR
jgi:predicted anti-sigma-YlaC factor YlaD